MFTVRIVTQNCLYVFVDMVTHMWISLYAEDGLWAKDSIGLPETMDCERPRLSSNNMHQNKVSVTCIARVGTRGAISQIRFVLHQNEFGLG
jgi:hypothetical protein